MKIDKVLLGLGIIGLFLYFRKKGEAEPISIAPSPTIQSTPEAITEVKPITTPTPILTEITLPALPEITPTPVSIQEISPPVIPSITPPEVTPILEVTPVSIQEIPPTPALTVPVVTIPSVEITTPIPSITQIIPPGGTATIWEPALKEIIEESKKPPEVSIEAQIISSSLPDVSVTIPVAPVITPSVPVSSVIPQSVTSYGFKYNTGDKFEKSIDGLSQADIKRIDFAKYNKLITVNIDAIRRIMKIEIIAKNGGLKLLSDVFFGILDDKVLGLSRGQPSTILKTI